MLMVAPRGRTKLVCLQKSMETIQGALMGIQGAPPVSQGMLGDRFQKICTDIGILGMKGTDELKKIVFTVMEFQKKEKSYQIKEVYEKVESL